MAKTKSQVEPVTISYYDTSGKKVGDFLIGFFGIWVLNSIFVAINSLIFGGFSGPSFSGSIGMLTSVFPSLILDIVLIVYFLKFSERKYIGIGMLNSVVLPLLIFGACLLVFSSMF